MGISPVTLPPELNPGVQEAAAQQNLTVPGATVQDNPAVQASTAQTEPGLQAVAQGAVQSQIQRLFLAGESVSQIANKIGLSPSEVDIELGISPASANLPAAAPAASPATAPGSTASPENASNATVAVATYTAVSEASPTTGTGQSQGGVAGSTLSINV